MAERPRLPIKVVPALERDYYAPGGGGGTPKVFGPVTSEVRERLVASVLEVRQQFAETFKKFPDVPAVARAKVRSDAIAKTHRPTGLFSGETCPVIGAERLGQLLVSATRTGLDNLAREIDSGRSKSTIANISTLESFRAYAPEVAVPRPTGGNEVICAKVKLFRHRVDASDSALERAFRTIVAEFSVENVHEVRYGPGLRVFKVVSDDVPLFDALSRFVGTQSIGSFPVYLPVRTVAVPLRGVQPEDFPPPEPGSEYPVVGVVDSGVAAGDPLLRPWVVGKEEYVPASRQDNTHGSFVSGLIAHAKHLNHSDDLFPSCSARILDVVALDEGGTTEDELITLLEDALRRHPDVRVWNLSLGTKEPCNDHRFSDFAVLLDRLQDDFGVTFVLAAGNYSQPPFRGWPPDDLQGADRICAPADSVRAIVVGSIAHQHRTSSRVRAGDPSPFSRRGPGPLYLPKPEVCHVGGNCNDAGVCSQVGVLSLDGKGNVAEDIGTSFATPLVSSLAANVQDRVVGGASRTLTRALLVHSAALRTGRMDRERLDYQGFGVPGDIDDILNCEPWRATLVFELTLAQNLAFQKATFPIPSCLYTNEDTVKADIVMTLVYEPPLDASFGAEYCRTNVEVSLGTYGIGPDGKYHQVGQVPPDPHLTGGGYEKDLVAYGFKWSSVKVYRREMVRGVKGQHWRLDMSVHHRSGHIPLGPQGAVLVITVADPAKRAPVYNEMVVEMAGLGWVTQDLQLHARLRA